MQRQHWPISSHQYHVHRLPFNCNTNICSKDYAKKYKIPASIKTTVRIKCKWVDRDQSKMWNHWSMIFDRDIQNRCHAVVVVWRISIQMRISVNMATTVVYWARTTIWVRRHHPTTQRIIIHICSLHRRKINRMLLARPVRLDLYILENLWLSCFFFFFHCDFR